MPHFRHRRGELEQGGAEEHADRLARHFESRVGDVLGVLVRPVAVFARPQGSGVGLVAQGRGIGFRLALGARRATRPLRGQRRTRRRLTGGSARLCLSALDGVFRGLGVRRGRVISIPDAGATLARVLLPAVGARAPTARRVRFGALIIDGDELRVELDATFAPGELTPLGTRALELARLVSSADDALSRGATDEARAGYLLALEQAPRHPELVRLIADIDLEVPERAEAALGMVVESLPATRAGITGAELLWRLGDFDGARQALSEAAGHEHYAPLAALLWCRCAERDNSALERRNALDRAVALAPGLELPRVRRFAARLGHGDSAGALADAEHLEAMTAGARGKHDSNLHAARAFFAAGFVREARRCFERALRYAPDDARATAGLARAFAGERTA